MSGATSSGGLLEREFLPTRAKILEIAATLDRIARCEESALASSQWQQLEQGLRILLEQKSDRAESVQLLFSRPYEAPWRESFGIQ